MLDGSLVCRGLGAEITLGCLGRMKVDFSMGEARERRLKMEL